MRSIGEIVSGMGWSDRLRKLARQVERLEPDRRDPEKFHVDKSEIAGELKRIAKEAAE